MHNAIPLTLAALIAVGIIVIGCFYLASPERVLGSFGLRPPAPDADTRAWLRLKGIRDVASGLVVLTMMLAADSRSEGIVLLVLAIIPFGDMSNILVSGGRKATAYVVAKAQNAGNLIGIGVDPGLGNAHELRGTFRVE